MKSITFILVTYVFFAMNAYGQLKIISDGSVGINESTPEKQLHIFDNNDEIQLLLENTYIAGDHAKSGAGIKFKNENNKLNKDIRIYFFNKMYIFEWAEYSRKP